MHHPHMRRRYPQADYEPVVVPISPEESNVHTNGATTAGVDDEESVDEEEQERAENWYDRWNDGISALPAQINRQQINMISIGGAIGTGLFLATSSALQYGGPVGLVLGYAVMGSVVYCTVISFGEMVAFQPYIGGPVGLAHMYVDEALAFALGWNAWYNWTIGLAAEISAAVLLLSYWTQGKYSNELTAVFMFFAVLINCLGTTWYGRFEVGFTWLKIITIISLIIAGFVIDVGGSPQGYIGFKNWITPGPFNGAMFAEGAWGQFLGFFSVLLQAAFSFFGTEVPAVAAGEVINAKKNIPKALRSIWVRITLFYVAGVFIISLLVRYDDPRLNLVSGTTNQSPFIIALTDTRCPGLPGVFNALFLISAWSAASSDIYISSRFMFDLARLGHAPNWMGYLYRPKWVKGNNEVVIPLVAILFAGLVSCVSFMANVSGTSSTVFSWLSYMTSAAALQSWIGILFTYIRWYPGTLLSMKRGQNRPSDFNRSWMQPWAAWYAFLMCFLILILNGWAVFVPQWRLALRPDQIWPPQQTSDNLTQSVSGGIIARFVTSYVPIPIFLLLLFGYKLIYRTKMVVIESMPSSLNYSRFDKPVVPEATLDFANMPWPKRCWYYVVRLLGV